MKPQLARFVLGALLPTFSPDLAMCQTIPEESSPKWSDFSDSVKSYTESGTDETPPEFITPCGPGQLRDPTTLSCIPGVSSIKPVIENTNPCGAGASCAPGVGLEGAQDLVDPGKLEGLSEQIGEFVK